VTAGSGATILVVEDDPSTTLLLRDVLEGAGHRVVHASTGAEAEALLEPGSGTVPDLIILDLILPDVDGLVLCASIRSRYDMPVIVCSATARKRDAVLAFKLGADDFVAKPFDVDELEARVGAALRRASQALTAPRAAVPSAAGGAGPARPLPEEQQIGALSINRVRRVVKLGGVDLRLTPTEYRLLATLMSRPDEVLEREELARQVWGQQSSGLSRAIDVHIRRLRAKLDAGMAPAPPIISIRGLGYKIAQERQAASA
jgi:DNA-binding response OmpR family regulator